MRFRCIASAILSSLCLATAALPAASAAQGATWKGAYAEWLSRQEQTFENDNVAILCDLDLDGVPELFWGNGHYLWYKSSVYYKELTSGVTMKDGKLTVFYQAPPSGTPKDDPNYYDMIYSDEISNIRLYQDRVDGTVHFIRPFIYEEEDYSVRYSWWLLSFPSGKVTIKYPCIIDVTTAGPQDGFGHGSPFVSGDISGDINNLLDIENVPQEVYFARLQRLSDRYQYLGSPALMHTDTPEDMKSGAPTAFWTEVNGLRQFNPAAVQSFLNSWSPGIILGDLTAEPASAGLLLDGTPRQLPAYRFYDNHYLKLRDFAALLSGTSKQFGVTWDGAAVRLTSGASYSAPVTPISGGPATARYSAQPIYLDGKELAIPAYQINGSNYVRLRDLAGALGIPVGWNAQTETIILQTK